MTDQQTLFTYRLNEAEETLADAQNMLANGVSARSIVNRAYYAMFTAVQGLLLNKDVFVKTHKPAKSYLLPGKLARSLYSFVPIHRDSQNEVRH